MTVYKKFTAVAKTFGELQDLVKTLENEGISPETELNAPPLKVNDRRGPNDNQVVIWIRVPVEEKNK
jgi:hypothetical protein